MKRIFKYRYGAWCFFFRFFFTHLVYVNSKSRTLGKGAPCCVTFREIFANSSTYHLLTYLRIILYFIICLFILSGTLTFFFVFLNFHIYMKVFDCCIIIYSKENNLISGYISRFYLFCQIKSSLKKNISTSGYFLNNYLFFTFSI